MLKVHRGTRSEGKTPLCDTCSRGLSMRGSADSAEKIYCYEISNFVKIKVVECSGYKHKNAVSLYDMREAAWILSTDKKKKTIGFQKYNEWKRGNPNEEILPNVYPD